MTQRLEQQAETPKVAGLRLFSEAQRALDLQYEAFKQEAYRSLAMVYRMR